ncbi:hypothetical protein J3R83DRAFT_11190 [Lanmaoa asiatica]|nr:hypothetical protein J3R83DRAFT_11190 [Lanmaoa asiatica]
MYEQASERWSPVQSVEKVILSVISMLAGTPSFSRFHSLLTIFGRTKPGKRSQHRLLQALSRKQTGTHPSYTFFMIIQFDYV